MRPVYNLTHKPDKKKSERMATPQADASSTHEPLAQIAQRISLDADKLTPSDVLQLQRVYGNRFVVQLLEHQQSPSSQDVAQIQTPFDVQHHVSSVAKRIIQKHPIDKDFVKTTLAQTSEGLMALDMLDRVKVYEYQTLKYRGVPKTSYATTLPHEDPPVIFFNEPKNASDEEATNTLYHEVQHAFDPETPPRDDDSEQALKQDLRNEAKVMKLEAEFAIKMGGAYLQEAMKFGSVKMEKGQYVVNNELLEKIVKGAYSNYAKEKRSDRFDMSNYVATGVRDLSGDWYPLEAYQYDIDYSHKPDVDEDYLTSYIK
ncbi:MAG: hypothetical protein D6737_09050 [Chloroflexi bacterium]|nr:MAG: hypothetical protein CUN54_07280 [Phototrophicales bacterium]RMF80141.1 MAG: hypothetical protein D6737_09050 [Chloroflexota bacterium]